MVPPGNPTSQSIPSYPPRGRFALLLPFILLHFVALSAPTAAPRAFGDDPLGSLSSTFSEEDQWWDGFSGTALDGPVRAMTYWEGMLVVGGSFQSAGGVPGTRGLAAWDGSAWISLGAPGVDAINALAVVGGDLFAGGRIFVADGAPSDYIMRRDGVDWNAVGSGLNGEVHGFGVQGTDLIVGGLFTLAGGVGANNIARWDGTAWSALGAGLPGRVNAITEWDGEIVAGGSFDSPGGGPDGIARWTGSDWSKLGGGMSEGEVRALAVFQGALFAGGTFPSAGGGNGPAFLARWDGGWDPVGSGTNGWVGALAVSGSSLFVGGGFNQAGGGPAGRIAVWNGSTWSVPGTGILGSSVLCLAADGAEVVAGGAFFAADGAESLNLAVWNGSNWNGSRSDSGNGLGGNRACAMLSEPNALYIGGDFTSAGGVPAFRVARWNGTAWGAVGSGMNATVFALAAYGGEIIAGGDFTEADGSPALHIARWNGTSWNPLGTGLNGSVHALAVYNGDLYAGGRFDAAGGVPVKNIARWDGTAWHDVGGGMEITGEYADVTALIVYGGTLVAGGEFLIAGGSSISTIARWNGTWWSSMGSGPWATTFVPRISALAEFGGDLIAGGNFTRAGGVTGARYIGRWDGSWHAMGDPDTTVSALAGCGGQLAAGTENEILFWDGSAWVTLGGGMGGAVHALAEFGGNLFGGGSFSRAGTKSSLHIARWGGQQTGIGDPARLPVVLQAFPNPFRSRTRVAFELEHPGSVSLRIFDLQGRLVQILTDGHRTQGAHTVEWDGRDMQGRRRPAGSYYLQIKTPDLAQTRKLLRIP